MPSGHLFTAVTSSPEFLIWINCPLQCLLHTFISVLCRKVADRSQNCCRTPCKTCLQVMFQLKFLNFHEVSSRSGAVTATVPTWSGLQQPLLCSRLQTWWGGCDRNSPSFSHILKLWKGTHLDSGSPCTLLCYALMDDLTPLSSPSLLAIMFRSPKEHRYLPHSCTIFPHIVLNNLRSPHFLPHTLSSPCIALFILLLQGLGLAGICHVCVEYSRAITRADVLHRSKGCWSAVRAVMGVLTSRLTEETACMGMACNCGCCCQRVPLQSRSYITGWCNAQLNQRMNYLWFRYFYFIVHPKSALSKIKVKNIYIYIRLSHSPSAE